MKKFTASLLLLLGLTFVLDRAGGRMMEWVQRHSADVITPKVRYLAREAGEDVILLGTSRCHYHYVPNLIADTLGMSVYNGGVEGSRDVYSHYVALHLVLAHHTPRVVCLDLVPQNIGHTRDPLGQMGNFAPHVGESPEADSVFRLAGCYWPYRLSHLYRYNLRARANFGSLFTGGHPGEDRGYVPLSPAPDSLLPPHVVLPPARADEQKMEYLRRFVRHCHSRGILLVFCVSPARALACPRYFAALEQWAEHHHVPLLNYHHLGCELPGTCFKDHTHLSHQGALLFSSLFARDLKTLIARERPEYFANTHLNPNNQQTQ